MNTFIKATKKSVTKRIFYKSKRCRIVVVTDSYTDLHAQNRF